MGQSCVRCSCYRNQPCEFITACGQVCGNTPLRGLIPHTKNRYAYVFHTRVYITRDRHYIDYHTPVYCLGTRHRGAALNGGN